MKSTVLMKCVTAISKNRKTKKYVNEPIDVDRGPVYKNKAVKKRLLCYNIGAVSVVVITDTDGPLGVIFVAKKRVTMAHLTISWPKTKLSEIGVQRRKARHLPKSIVGDLDIKYLTTKSLSI